MRIVVLDGYTLNPGDLSWEDLRKLAEVVLHDRTAPNELEERLKGADALLTNKVAISGDLMKRLPALRYIGVTATGYNIVDIAAASERRIAA